MIMVEALFKLRVVRFIVSGGTSFSVNLVLLYGLTEFLGLWYLFSTTFSFVIAFLVGFSMNKLWTFKERETDRIRWQISFYLLVNLMNLALNHSMLYMFVESFHIWYIAAQALASIIIAFESFFVYRWIFRTKIVSAPA